MNGLVLALVVFAAAAAAVLCAAACLVLGAVGTAALLPRGAPLADDLRRFAGNVPRHIWRAIRWLDGLVIAAIVVMAVVLTVALS